ncbi:MAG: hypothetical protein ACQESE_01470 [Nanobdellota archaeon]
MKENSSTPVDVYVSSGQKVRDQVLLENISSLTLSSGQKNKTIDFLLSYTQVKDRFQSLELNVAADNTEDNAVLYDLHKQITKTENTLKRTIDTRVEEIRQEVSGKNKITSSYFKEIMDSLNTMYTYAQHISANSDSLYYNIESVCEQALQKTSKKNLSYERTHVDGKNITIYTSNEKRVEKEKHRQQRQEEKQKRVEEKKKYHEGKKNKLFSSSAIATYIIGGTAALILYISSQKKEYHPPSTPSQNEIYVKPASNEKHQQDIQYHDAILRTYETKQESEPEQKKASDEHKNYSETNHQYEHSKERRRKYGTSKKPTHKQETKSATEKHMDKFFGTSASDLENTIDSIEANNGLVKASYVGGR